MSVEVLTSLFHFGLLLGLRVLVRELGCSEFLSLELFNCNARYPTYGTRQKLRVVNALFRFIAFVLFVCFYMVQTAVCCLVYGVVPGKNVKFVLVEMIFIDLVCLCGQFFTVRISSLKRAQRKFWTNWKSALHMVATETLYLNDVVNFVTCRRVWQDLGLFLVVSIVRYDKPSVVHCAFVQACYIGLSSGRGFIAALGTLGFNEELAVAILAPLQQFDQAIKLTNRVLQGLVLTKLTLGHSFNLLYAVYLLFLPFTLGFVG